LGLFYFPFETLIAVMPAVIKHKDNTPKYAIRSQFKGISMIQGNEVE
jgi:hypothetical protein